MKKSKSQKYWEKTPNNKINNTYNEVVLILTNKLIYIEGYKKNNICKYFLFKNVDNFIYNFIFILYLIIM